jgi:hypothetical protein
MYELVYPSRNFIKVTKSKVRGYAVVCWLRHYATSRKVAGSIPDVIGFFNQPNPSSCTMPLGSTQPLTEMCTRNLPGGKGQQAGA